MTKIIPTNLPTTVILHGGNTLGIKLSETLATQRSHIILIDEFTRTTKDAINVIRKKQAADAYDLSAVPTLSENLRRVDYVIILLDQYLSNNPSVSSKKFLTETNVIDTLCKLALQQGAKVILTTSLDLHRRLVTTQHSQADTLKDVSAQRPYSTIELQHYCENLVAEYHDQSMLNVRIARIGELMGDGIQLTRSSIFIQMLKESITRPRITIPSEGLDSMFYVHTLDAVYGIVKALFSNKTNGEVYSLTYPDEISTLNLAYKILEMNPVASEIAFGKDSNSVLPTHIYVPAKNMSRLGWEPKIPFDQALHETMAYCFKSYRVEWKDKPEPVDDHKAIAIPVVQRTKQIGDRSEHMTSFGIVVQRILQPFRGISESIRGFAKGLKNRTLSRKTIVKVLPYTLGTIFLFYVLIAPVIQLTAGAVGSYYFAKKAYQEAVSLDTHRAETSLSRARYCIELTRSGWDGLRWITIVPNTKAFYSETATLISAADHAAAGGYYLVLGAEPYADYFKNFEPLTSFNQTAGGGSREYTEELEMMRERVSYFETAGVEVSLAQELFSDVDTTVFPGFVSKRLTPLFDMTEQVQTSLATIQSFAVQAPEMLGIDGRKTYIVLFQNPMELRSTGGWITSVGIVGVEHGQIRELEVRDVYDIDGQITETVSPPQSMKDELGVEDWTLSLANWSPDFPITAEAVEYFLSLSGDAVTTDGVIAMDLEFVRNLVDIWGSIEVPGESEAVTKDNLYDKVIEIHREFTPGSTQKPLFLSNLANEILQKILSSSRETWPDIARVASTALSEKHILIFFNDPSLNDVIETNGWGGQIEASSNILFPVEWNWGGNKANYFLDRSTDISVTISDETRIQQAVTVTYENNSTVNEYPEGNYENYERLYIPLGAKVTRIDGLTRVSVTHDSVQGTTVVSGWITVPVATEKSFTVSYLLEKGTTEFPIANLPDDTYVYTFDVIKQPGLDDDPITIKITFPEGWTPLDITDFHREINALISLDKLSEDKSISVSWQL
jgi:nucleoside-diphosphate-sugar epimerase